MQHLIRSELRYPGLWRGCVGAWAPLLGPSGTTLRDNSVMRYHTTLTNMDPPTDWIVSGSKYALDFDGSNDHCTTTGTFSIATGVTMAVWVKFTSTNTNCQALGLGNSSDNNPLAWLGIGATTKRGRWLVRDNASNALDQNTTADINTGDWVHLVGTLAMPSNLQRLYVNGIQVASGTNTIGTATLNTIGIGAAVRASTGNYFPGTIDDARWYDRALTAQEVALLARRRGIAYERAQRRSRKVPAVSGFQAAWVAQRRAEIIGA